MAALVARRLTTGSDRASWRLARRAASTATADVVDLQDTANSLVRATPAALPDVGDGQHVFVTPEFITEDEEARLLAEATRRLQRMPYEAGHFDQVIHHYRELLGFKHISPECAAVLARGEATTRERCGNDPAFGFLPVHILDLRADGYIQPHLDAYCGRCVAGVSLGSESVMRLTRPDRPNAVVDLLLPRRSYYCLQYGLMQGIGCMSAVSLISRANGARYTMTGACFAMYTATRSGRGRWCFEDARSSPAAGYRSYFASNHRRRRPLPQASL